MSDEYRIPADQAWPHSGPEFNAWEDDVFALVRRMEAVKDQPWWTSDSQLKYISLWIDARDGGFILKDRDGNRVSPDRVMAALANWSKFVEAS
jgi:hypothetical protein